MNIATTTPDSKKILKLSVLAGEIMLSNGAEIYRVEETMRSIVLSFGCQMGESFVTPTGIFASVESSDSEFVTLIKRVKTRTTHLEKVAEVNSLSRNIALGTLTLDEAFKKLKRINELPQYPIVLRILCAGISCFCFTYMFGGVLADCLDSFVIASALYSFKDYAETKKMSKVIMNIFGGAFVALAALIMFNLGFGVNIDKIVIGSIMPLVPGVLLTNAIRDVLEGDFLSGTTSGVDAIIVAVSIATGVGSAYALWFHIFGGLPL